MRMLGFVPGTGIPRGRDHTGDRNRGVVMGREMSGDLRRNMVSGPAKLGQMTTTFLE